MVRQPITLPAAGIGTENKRSTKDKVKVWPELVMRETIASLAALIGLALFAIFIDAPLEGVADPSFSTNPSKAPWYFLGLQELLVYFSPWVAGVLIPTLIVAGLMAIPYIDTGIAPKKTGLQKGIFLLFTTGIVLWICLTIIGLYFRGANWAWQLPWNPQVMIGAGQHVSMNWFVPVVLISYLCALGLRFKIQQKAIKSLGFSKYFISHALFFTGLAVTSKIVAFTIFDFLL